MSAARLDDDSFVEFGDEQRKKGLFRRPLVVVGHLGFRIAALLVYMFLSSGSFIISFLLIISLLSFDFWTVKNITGRLLVGLRWWNFVDGEGNSHWRFESRKDMASLSANDVRVFWAALVAVPVLWALLATVCLLSLRPTWLIVCLMALGMSGANLYGYLRCKWNSRQELTSFMSNKLFTTMLTQAAATNTSSGGNKNPSMMETI